MAVEYITCSCGKKLGPFRIDQANVTPKRVVCTHCHTAYRVTYGKGKIEKVEKL